MKCSHDKCNNLVDEADDANGFCNKCIQLNTEQCNCCNMQDKPVTKCKILTNWFIFSTFIIFTYYGIIYLGHLSEFKTDIYRVIYNGLFSFILGIMLSHNAKQVKEKLVELRKNNG